MSDYANSLYSAVLGMGGLVSSHVSAAAAAGRDKEIQKILDRQHREAQQLIDDQNRMARSERDRTYRARQAIDYRLSVVQMMDAEYEAQEFRLMSQDFLNKAGFERGQMSYQYSRSGALMAGSALARTKQNREEGAEGARRLERAAEYAIKRGQMLAKITRTGTVKTPYVPIPDAVKKTYVPRFVPQTGGGRGGYGGGRGGYGGGGGGGSNRNVVAWTDAANPDANTEYTGAANPFMQAFQEGGVHIPPYGLGAGGYYAPNTGGMGLTTGAFDFGAAGDEWGRREQEGWTSDPNAGLAANTGAAQPLFTTPGSGGWQYINDPSIRDYMG